ncbi:hypothetical protein AGMMS49965_17200 [Bacteroidia bacterium]|nr:hypothetical protein AGMMS49965_17200 [Bacteroidia bacterium]
MTMNKKVMILAAAAVVAGTMIVGCRSSNVQQRVSDGQRGKINSNTEQYRTRTSTEMR